MEGNLNLLKRSSIKSKKGMVGVNMAISFLGAILVLVILGFVLIVMAGNLLSSGDSSLPLKSATVRNETLTTVTEVGETLSTSSRYLCTTSSIIVTNATSGVKIAADNFTVDTCATVRFTGVGHAGYNNTNWNITFDYNYKEPFVRDTLNNASGGVATFFSNAGTWFTMISLLIVIGVLIALVVMARKGVGKGSSNEY